MFKVLILVFSLSLMSCAAVPPAEMDMYKQCSKSLKRVRMNFLKNGYEIKADEPEFIMTKAQSPHFGYDALWLTFLVEKSTDTSSVIITKYEPNGRLMEIPAISSNVRLFKDVKRAFCN